MSKTNTTTTSQNTSPQTDTNDVSLTTAFESTFNNEKYDPTKPPPYRIQITPSIELSTTNQDLITYIHELFENVDREYAKVNGINVPDFIRRPTALSEILTGTPSTMQINIMSQESGLEHTDNSAGSAKGYAQFMRNTTIDNASKISQNKGNNDVIQNLQALMPKDIRIAYSKHHDKLLDRLTILDPNKLTQLPREHQKLILEQKEPILNWTRGLENKNTLDNKSIEAMKKLAIINPTLYAELKDNQEKLLTDFNEKTKSYEHAQNPESDTLEDTVNILRDEAGQALENIQEFKRNVINIFIKQFSDLVEKADNTNLTNELHHAINNNTSITIAQLGLHTSHNIKILKNRNIPVTEKTVYDAHFSGIGTTIETWNKLQSAPNEPVWRIFGKTQEEAEHKYGFVMKNKINRQLYMKCDPNGECEYNTIAEYMNIIKQKGFSSKEVRLGQPDKLITEAIASGEATLSLTDPDVQRVFKQVETYAQRINEIESTLYKEIETTNTKTPTTQPTTLTHNKM